MKEKTIRKISIILILLVTVQILSSAKTIKVGLSFFQVRGIQRQKEYSYFLSASKKKNIDLKQLDAGGDVQRQKEQIDSLINSGIDCLIYLAYDDVLIPVLEEARKKGIKLIRYDYYVDYLPSDLIVTIRSEGR